jgi:ethanolamine ammonia-lyase light subunit EutC
LGEKTPNRRWVQPGDKVVFYTGIPHKSFAGSATLRSASFTLSPAEQEQLAHGTQLFQSNYGVWLEDLVIWEHPRRVEDLLPSLEVIKNKISWYAYFQGRVRQLGEKDFQTICSGVIPATKQTRGLTTTASDTDANRNLISNIHGRGVSTEHAAQRILNLAALMMKNEKSGFQLGEELPTEVAPAHLPRK